MPQAALRHETGKYLDATASAAIAAGYFNQALFRWEPVVEEAPIAFALHRDEGDDAVESQASHNVGSDPYQMGGKLLANPRRN